MHYFHSKRCKDVPRPSITAVVFYKYIKRHSPYYNYFVIRKLLSMGICNSSDDFHQEGDRIPQLYHPSFTPEAIPDQEIKKVLDGLFAAFDKDNDNYLDLAEVEAMMKHAHFRRNSRSETSLRDDALAFMEEADKKKDGKIDHEEFY
jgi:hypothetical protein